MMKKLILLTILLSCTLRLTAETITLEQVRTLALANSRSLAKYNLAIRSSLLDERSQLYSNFPTLSLGANASIKIFNDNWSMIENPAETFSAGANISLSSIKLFDGGKGLVQMAISKIATESTRRDALAEYFNVLDSADSAYYAALEAAATLKSEELALQIARNNFSMAEIRQAGGMINQGDYLKILADKESKEASFNQARRNFSLQTAKLKSITALGEMPELEPVDFDAYAAALNRLGGISDDEAESLYNEFWNILATGNPSLAKSALANQRAEKNLSLAKREFSPTINASIFSTGINYSVKDGFGSSVGGISVTGNIPLDYWVKANSLEKSRLAREQSALDYSGQVSNLEIELQTALLNAIAQAGTALSASRTVEYAEKHFEFVSERYRLSQSSISDLLDAASLAGSSRNNLIRAQYGFLQSLSKLRSLGAIDDEAKLAQILTGEK